MLKPSLPKVKISRSVAVHRTRHSVTFPKPTGKDMQYTWYQADREPGIYRALLRARLSPLRRAPDSQMVVRLAVLAN